MADPINAQVAAADAALKSELTIKYGSYEYVFKIPTIGDRIRITTRAAEIRKEYDTGKAGIALGYDPSTVNLTERIATFLVLVQGSDAPWVYTPDPTRGGAPIMDIQKWPDDVPVMEVVDQFNEELAAFRAQRA